MTSEARKRLKRMTDAQRLAAHRAKVAMQERAAIDLLGIASTATQAIELDGLENLISTAEAAGSITSGRAAGIRDVVRGIRKRIARKEAR